MLPIQEHGLQTQRTISRRGTALPDRWRMDISKEIRSDRIILKNLAAHSRDFSRELAASLNSLFQ